MWSTEVPSERLEESWKTRWFPYMFGTSERCQAVDDWAAGKHQKGVKPQLLSDRWLHERAEQFLADYEAMMLSFCKKKWPRTTSSEEKAEEDQAAEFQFKADGSVPDSAPNLHKRKNRNLTDALLYYSSEVVSPELRNRLLRLKEEKESKQQRVTWQDAKELFLSYMEKPNMRLLLYSLTCTKRSDEEQWIDWVQGMILLKINCKKYGLMLPDELWADLAWCQSSSTERKIVGKRPAALEDLEKEVAKLPPRDLPTYRQSMCTRELARIPSINSKSKRRKDVKNLGINQGKSQPSPAGKSYCGYCRRQNAGHEFKDCPKLAKRKL